MKPASFSHFEQFTASEACQLFERHTGFVFHATVPGQLAARFGIPKADPDARPSTYDTKHWRDIWAGMMKLAKERCKHQKDLTPPRENYPATIHAARGGMLPSSRVSAKSVVQTPAPDTPVPPAPKDAKPDELLPHPQRCFIKVPYAEKDEAKALGAKWDFAFRMWYVPDDKDRKLFRWPDELMPRFMRLMQPTDGYVASPTVAGKPKATPNKHDKTKKKRTKDSGRSVAGIRMINEMDDRLKHILDND